MSEDYLELKEGEDIEVENDEDDNNVDFDRSTSVENSSFCIKENTVK